jgi:hypothetical protein
MSILTNTASRSADEAAEYTRAILGLIGSRDPMAVLASTPAEIQRLVADLSEAQSAQPESKGKWSIRQVVQHLADGEIIWGWRMRMVLSHERPAITGYDQDAWATRLAYHDVPLPQSLADFEYIRGINLRLLSRISPQDLDRVGVHAERGEESVRHMMKMYAGHDTLHLRQVERIKAVVCR